MGQVVFTVEPESRGGGRWCIKRSGSTRATYNSRAQAVMDARQLAAFENELHGHAATVRVLDLKREPAEDFVCTARALPLMAVAKAAGTKSALR